MTSPKNFLRKTGTEWRCRECGHPLGEDKGLALVLMNQHMENHGVVADPSRGGSSGSSAGDFGSGLVDAVLGAIDVITGG